MELLVKIQVNAELSHILLILGEPPSSEDFIHVSFLQKLLLCKYYGMLCWYQVPAALYIVYLLHSLLSTENKSLLNVYTVKCTCYFKSYILFSWCHNAYLHVLYVHPWSHPSFLPFAFHARIPTSSFPPWFWANNNRQSHWQWHWRLDERPRLRALSQPSSEQN